MTESSPWRSLDPGFSCLNAQFCVSSDCYGHIRGSKCKSETLLLGKLSINMVCDPNAISMVSVTYEEALLSFTACHSKEDHKSAAPASIPRGPTWTDVMRRNQHVLLRNCHELPHGKSMSMVIKT